MVRKYKLPVQLCPLVIQLGIYSLGQSLKQPGSLKSSLYRSSTIKSTVQKMPGPPPTTHTLLQRFDQSVTRISACARYAHQLHSDRERDCGSCYRFILYIFSPVLGLLLWRVCSEKVSSKCIIAAKCSVNLLSVYDNYKQRMRRRKFERVLSAVMFMSDAVSTTPS